MFVCADFGEATGGLRGEGLKDYRQSCLRGTLVLVELGLIRQHLSISKKRTVTCKVEQKYTLAKLRGTSALILYN